MLSKLPTTEPHPQPKTYIVKGGIGAWDLRSGIKTNLDPCARLVCMSIVTGESCFSMHSVSFVKIRIVIEIIETTS
jgi:hypothetical protein